ncbi:aspartic peptidase domain-containing protein [Boletus edulis]|nr:aspartic peptidase domain-containing protein [Boletus edulis]
MKQGSQLGKRSQVNEVDAPYIGAYYVAQVGVGSPATNHTLVLDTGSANTLSIQYAEGTFYGEEWIDTVTLSPDLVINQQSIGVSHVFSFNNSDGIDGVLGIGPVDLTENTVDGVDTVLTVMDNLHSQGTISEVFGVFFKPDLQVGELTFGSYDESAISGPMLYFPVTTTPPASGFWGTELSIGYGNDTILSSAAGVFSTSVPFIALAVVGDAHNNYKSKTGATFDLATGYLTITPEQYNHLESLVLST